MSRESTRRDVEEGRRCQREAQAFELISEVKYEAQRLRATLLVLIHSQEMKEPKTSG